MSRSGASRSGHTGLEMTPSAEATPSCASE